MKRRSAGSTQQPKRTLEQKRLYARALQEYGTAQYEAALRTCMQLYADSETDLDVLLLLSAIHFNLRNYDKSLYFSKRAVTIDPSFAEPYGNMGNVFKERAQYDTALLFYEKAVRLKPSFADAHGNMASVLLQLGRTEEAFHSYREAVRLKPENCNWQVDLGHLYRSRGDVLEAEECFQRAIKINPRFSVAWSNLACVNKDQGHVGKAIKQYQRSIALDPSFFDAYANLGNVYRDAAMFEEALKVYRRALELRPGAVVVQVRNVTSLLTLPHVDGPSLAGAGSSSSRPRPIWRTCSSGLAGTPTRSSCMRKSSAGSQSTPTPSNPSGPSLWTWAGSTTPSTHTSTRCDCAQVRDTSRPASSR